MSYKCELCRTPVPIGKPKMKHIVYKPDRSIQREYSACAGCIERIESGVPMLLIFTEGLLKEAATPKRVRQKATPIPPPISEGVSDSTASAVGMTVEVPLPSKVKPIPKKEVKRISSSKLLADAAIEPCMGIPKKQNK